MALDISEAREFEWKIKNFTRDALKQGKHVKSEVYPIILDNIETTW